MHGTPHVTTDGLQAPLMAHQRLCQPLHRFHRGAFRRSQRILRTPLVFWDIMLQRAKWKITHDLPNHFSEGSVSIAMEQISQRLFCRSSVDFWLMQKPHVFLGLSGTGGMPVATFEANSVEFVGEILADGYPMFRISLRERPRFFSHMPSNPKPNWYFCWQSI